MTQISSPEAVPGWGSFLPALRSRLIIVPLLALLASCAAPLRRAPAAALAPSAHVSHVIVVSIDGLRPDAIPWARARTLQRLMDEGAFSLSAHTILPSLTLPSHTSMLTGVGVEKHGITWNTDQTSKLGVVGVPTMFEVAREAGLETAFFVGKRKLKHLLRPNSLDYRSYPQTDSYLLADRVAEEAVQYLSFEEPNLLFVHLPDPDLAGHVAGWMSPAYRRAVRRADSALGYIWAAARKRFGDDFVLIVTADHGGHRRSHGTAEEQEIPWIVWGNGVDEGRIAEQIDTYDTAATALWLLGVPRPADWDGAPVQTAFDVPTAPAALPGR